MKLNTKLVFSGTLAVVAVASSGCRTFGSSDSSYYPKPKDVPAAVEDESVSPVDVSRDAAVGGQVPAASVSVAPGAASSQPLPVVDASSVGKPGTYREFVITDDGADRSYMFTSDGLSGQTGRHVPAPAPAPDPVASPAPAQAGSGFYVVQAGDIFGRIARKNGVSEKALLAANPSVKDPNRIRVGQKLAIPAAGTGVAKSAASGAKSAAKKPAAAGASAAKAAAMLPAKPGYVVYVVKSGDILGRVAKQHGTSVKAIMEANGIVDDRKVRAGKAIYIPSASAAAPVAAPADKAEPSAEAPAPVVGVEPAPGFASPAPEAPADPYLSL